MKTTQFGVICLNPKHFPWGFCLSCPFSIPHISKENVLQAKKKNPTFHGEKQSAEIYSQSLRQYFKLSKEEELLFSTQTE